MKSIENKIPPPILALFIAFAMWGVSRFQPGLFIDSRLRIVLLIMTNSMALLFGAGGILAFRFAKTTIDPVSIDRASRVVSDGIFRVTRNPMYVGLTALLAGWAIFLSVPLSFPGPVVFALFIHFIQILPEERAMEVKFGRDFLDYKDRVPRWLL